MVEVYRNLVKIFASMIYSESLQIWSDDIASGHFVNGGVYMSKSVESPYSNIDTPALLIDYKVMLDNIRLMQEKANRYAVGLRPHTKTHKMPEIARMQMKSGAVGITVAKVGEAEVMADNGLDDIFIANEIVGLGKLERIRAISRKAKVRLGIDNHHQVDELEVVFADEPNPIEVLIEVEVGEVRSGIVTEKQLVELVNHVKNKKNVLIKGVFSHEGHTYKAKDIENCIALSLEAQRRTLHMADIVRKSGARVDIVSIGSTPSMLQAEIIRGITEIRPGTYVFMDVGQGSGLGYFDKCAATVLASVISKPTNERIVIDAGAKALTSQNRNAGICATYGFGLVKNSDNVRLEGMFDEHGIINNEKISNQLRIGHKIEIIPNHICPCCNLYDKAYLVCDNKIMREVNILGRGKLQ